MLRSALQTEDVDVLGVRPQHRQQLLNLDGPLSAAARVPAETHLQPCAHPHSQADGVGALRVDPNVRALPANVGAVEAVGKGNRHKTDAKITFRQIRQNGIANRSLFSNENGIDSLGLREQRRFALAADNKDTSATSAQRASIANIVNGVADAPAPIQTDRAPLQIIGQLHRRKQAVSGSIVSCVEGPQKLDEIRFPLESEKKFFNPRLPELRASIMSQHRLDAPPIVLAPHLRVSGNPTANDENERVIDVQAVDVEIRRRPQSKPVVIR